MDGSPTVTVVIPTHNRRQLVQRTLDSVLRQRDVALEVVVVDDGGSDGTTDALRALRLDNVRVIRHESSRGVSAARNAGLATAVTPWVAFVDDDDLWAPTKVRSQLAALQEAGDARWACVGAAHVDAALQVVSYNPTPPSGRMGRRILHYNTVPGGGSGLLVDTALTRDIGGFDERMSILADWEFALRLSVRSPVVSVDRPLVAYYVHSDSMYHNPPGVLRELCYMEAKHQRLPGGRSFRFPRGPWLINLAMMSRRIGDDRAARAYRWKGLRHTATVPVATEAVRQVRLWAQQRGAGRFPFDESVMDWLDRYAGWRADPVAQ